MAGDRSCNSSGPPFSRDELVAVRRIFLSLGWRLRIRRHIVPAGIIAGRSKHIVTWLDSGDFDEVLLQVNRVPHWCAAVCAIRYRIFSGWHPFHVAIKKEDGEAESHRVKDYLARKWFDSRAGRRAYRVRHPECAGWSWGRIRRQAEAATP